MKVETMKPELLTMYRQLHAQHMEILQALEVLKAQTTDLKDRADNLYALKRSADLLTETRAAVNRGLGRYEKEFVILSLTQEVISLQTPWCTITVTAKRATKVPTLKKDPDAYTIFLKQILEVTNDEVIQSGVITLDFFGWTELYTKMQENGIELPDGLHGKLEEYDRSSTTIRKRKDLLTD